MWALARPYRINLIHSQFRITYLREISSTSRPDTRMTGAPPETGSITGVPDRALEAGLRTNKITADVIAAPPETAFNTSARDRASEASLRTNKITAEVTLRLQRRDLNTSVRDRPSEGGLRTNKIAADGPASIQGFVKDAKGEPIKGADVRIESQDGKHVLSTAKTDSKGRYFRSDCNRVFAGNIACEWRGQGLDYEHADQCESTDSAEFRSQAHVQSK